MPEYDEELFDIIVKGLSDSFSVIIKLKEQHKKLLPLKAENNQLKNTIEEMSKLIGALQNRIHEWEQAFNEIQQKLSHMDNVLDQLAHAKSIIVQKDATITELQAELAKLPQLKVE